MELKVALAIASEVIERLKPYCKKNRTGSSLICVVGSIRRQKPTVHDIDIVLIPSDPWGLNTEIQVMGAPYQPHIAARGPKIQRLVYKGAQVDIYMATEQTWATLILIRTGSKENNIRLCMLAKSKGLILHADGSGLFKLDVQGCEGKEVRLAGDTEHSIYEALGLPFQRPEERG